MIRNGNATREICEQSAIEFVAYDLRELLGSMGWKRFAQIRRESGTQRSTITAHRSNGLTTNTTSAARDLAVQIDRFARFGCAQQRIDRLIVLRVREVVAVGFHVRLCSR